MAGRDPAAVDAAPLLARPRAQRPTTVGWQRADDEERVGRFLGDVTTSTGTSAF